MMRGPHPPGTPGLNVMSIFQPWASLLVVGARAYDVQHHPTHYRGELGIFAPLHFPDWARNLAVEPEFAGPLARAGLEPWALPRGVLLGVADLVDVIPIVREGYVGTVAMCSVERRLGDYKPGRFAYRYERIRRLREPIGHRGRAGIWHWNVGRPLVFTESPTAPR
jgi:activating signal cointegrator 1